MKLKLDLAPKIPNLQILNRRNSYVDIAGIRKAVVKKGIEFDHYREYNATDDGGLIDWKASLRATRMLVKVFEEDRSTGVQFLIDTGTTMMYGTTDKLKMEYAFELVSSLNFGILNNGDQIAVMLFNKDIPSDSDFFSGVDNYGIFQNEFENFQSFGGKTDFTIPILHVTQRSRKTNVVVIISDFLTVSPTDLVGYLGLIQKNIDLIGIMINDPTDIYIPPDLGLVSLRDQFSNELKLVNSGNATEEYNRKNKQRIMDIQGCFENMNGDFLLLRTDENFENKVFDFIQYRNMR
jgi:uncharacterized protein (DUF58 family)